MQIFDAIAWVHQLLLKPSHQTKAIQSGGASHMLHDPSRSRDYQVALSQQRANLAQASHYHVNAQSPNIPITQLTQSTGVSTADLDVTIARAPDTSPNSSRLHPRAPI